MNIYEWLEQPERIDALIAGKLAEHQQLMDLATNITSISDGMPHGKGAVPQKIQDIAVKLAELSKDIDKLVDGLVDKKREIVATLEQLPPNEYLILHKHYIEYKTWEQVADEMRYSTVHIWRLKQKAYNNLQRILQNVIVCNG